MAPNQKIVESQPRAKEIEMTTQQAAAIDADQPVWLAYPLYVDHSYALAEFLDC